MKRSLLYLVQPAIRTMVGITLALSILAGSAAQAACDCVGSWTKHVLETLSVPSNGATVYSTTTLETGKVYYLKASGTYTYWPGSAPYGTADAQCTDRPPYSYGPGWVHTSFFGQGGMVVVNGSGLKMGPVCNTIDHTYISPYVGQGRPVSFSIFDDVYSDNSGSLTVEIYECI